MAATWEATVLPVVEERVAVFAAAVRVRVDAVPPRDGGVGVQSVGPLPRWATLCRCGNWRLPSGLIEVRVVLFGEFDLLPWGVGGAKQHMQVAPWRAPVVAGGHPVTRHSSCAAPLSPSVELEECGEEQVLVPSQQSLSLLRCHPLVLW